MPRTDEQRAKQRVNAKRWRTRHPELVAAYNKMYRETHQEYFTAKQREYNKRKRDAYKAYKASLVCVKCGKSDDIHFHHVNPADKQGDNAKARKRSNISELARTVSRDKWMTEAAKCVPLCKTCHERLHAYCEQLALTALFADT